MSDLIVSVSGVRGTVGSALTPPVACAFGCAMGTLLGCGRTVVIGRDSRTSGPMLRSALTAGLLGTGVSVIDLGMVTTPGVALMVRKLSADGGVILTASHNPFEYNGIKFLSAQGTGLTAANAAKLKDIWQSGQFSFAGPDGQGNESRNTKTHGEHVDAVVGRVDMTAIASRRFKVVLDSINGAGCVATPLLLGMLGCETRHLNSEATGRFAHRPEPTAENLQGLCEEVRRIGADVGFAQDPDADRLALVDEQGDYIGEEYTLALCAAHVLRRKKGNLATNLTTSRMIDDVAAAAGVQVFRSPTGEANVVEMMMKNACIFGGEGNGGVIDPAVVPVRDSLVGIAYILQALAETGQTLSELVAEIPRYQMLKTKFDCPAEATGDVLRRTRSAFESRPQVRFNTDDGLRIDLPEGWLTVRASNTEPIMRIMAEAPDHEAAEALVAEARAIADEVLGGK